MSKQPVAQPTSVAQPPAGTDPSATTAVVPAQRTPQSARPTLDPETLAEIYRLHGGYLLRALLRATHGDRGKAEDILQETLLRAWQNPAALAAGAEQSRPWLFTVARRIAIDHHRMAAARAKEMIGEPMEDRPLNEDPYEQVVAARDIALALRRVQKHHREVLVELHLRDHSVLEAAARLGVPPGTVKSRNFYAIRALRPVLAAEHGYGPADRGQAAALDRSGATASR
ncbi:RNA polymerase sigma-70 factor (ECF subfamily) [Kitasatospora sp. MAA19]|uniref:sigma-70 family RNA polymerase sigma factor n=1 Tax=unclassified Kitasatospora TaxID=2633591 RepID=UPI0024748AE4|nr:sigma-70 family RNA polymerase sigma factor [Kitasatospora sp. MAA19]MDH6707591.1 RNA polymerase sigma-70 factor (ECF subfamily) [Kitasatospora sp. MAA19]